MVGHPFTYTEGLPPGALVSPARLIADDGIESAGWLYQPAGPPRRTVLWLAHPRVEFSRHYLIPALLSRGVSVFGQDLRTLHNDSEQVHERLLLDLAVGMRHLRERFERVVLVGNSGGGALLASYQDHAQRAPGERPRETAGGGRIDLTGPMPAGDGLVVFAAHPGEGPFLLGAIDPSVTDESDPLSCDPALDMFNPENGYDLPTRSARYTPEFLQRYRQAQRARVERLDQVARDQIALERDARASLGRPASAYDLLRSGRRAVPHRLLVVYRTVANPATLDLSLDPSDREVGTIFGILGARPEVGNYYAQNLARVVSPRAWLSTWSGVSSRVDFRAAAASLAVPTFFSSASADTDILPAAAESMWSAIAAPDRTRHDLQGADHYLRATARRASSEHPRAELVRVLTAWLGDRGFLA
jgi:alpha-beta hydrolase superfamily lysophospholipase